LHLPIWPVAVLVAAIAAVTIAVTMIGEPSQVATRPFRLTGEAANSTTAIREGGVVIPVVWSPSHVTPSAVGFAGLENPGAYPGVNPESDFSPTTGARPGMDGSEICGQCR
jgi:hypothetical protein